MFRVMSAKLQKDFRKSHMLSNELKDLRLSPYAGPSSVEVWVSTEEEPQYKVSLQTPEVFIHPFA